jgi:hypothetical protein
MAMMVFAKESELLLITQPLHAVGYQTFKKGFLGFADGLVI